MRFSNYIKEKVNYLGTTCRKCGKYVPDLRKPCSNCKWDGHVQDYEDRMSFLHGR